MRRDSRFRLVGDQRCLAIEFYCGLGSRALGAWPLMWARLEPTPLCRVPCQQRCRQFAGFDPCWHGFSSVYRPFSTVFHRFCGFWKKGGDDELGGVKHVGFCPWSVVRRGCACRWRITLAPTFTSGDGSSRAPKAPRRLRRAAAQTARLPLPANRARRSSKQRRKPPAPWQTSRAE